MAAKGNEDPPASSLIRGRMPHVFDPKAEEVAEVPEVKPTEMTHGTWWVFGQLGSVALFVALGAGKAFSVRLSMAPDGSLPYDTSAAVTCAEAVKLLASLVWVLVTGQLNGLRRPPPPEWARDCGDLLLIAVLYAVTNELNFLVLQHLGAGLFIVMGNLKIAFTCVFMTLLLRRHFSLQQWVAVSLLTLSAIAMKLGSLGSLEGSKLSGPGLALSLISSATSGLASVANELVLKREGTGPPMPFMAKNCVLYAWGLCINLISWKTWGTHSFFDGFNWATVSSIACLAGLGMACSIILGYLDNVVRCFSAVAQVLITVAFSRLLPARLHEGSFDIGYAVALILLSLAIVLYQAHQSKQLMQHLLFASAAAVGIAVLCGLLERWAKGA